MTVHEAYRRLQAITANWKPLKSEATVNVRVNPDSGIIDKTTGPGEKAQRVQHLTAKLDGTSLSLGTHMAEGKRLLQQVVL